MNRIKRVTYLASTALKVLKRSPAPTPKHFLVAQKAKWAFHCTILLSLTKTTLEEDLHQAINQDEQALLQVINELHQLILTSSRKYRECLTKQIGALREENSDQVTECRVLANELVSELDEYWVLLRVLSEIVGEQSAFEEEEELDSVARVFKRVKVVALEEFEANKQKELELLKAQYEHILQSD